MALRSHLDIKPSKLEYVLSNSPAVAVRYVERIRNSPEFCAGEKQSRLVSPVRSLHDFEIERGVKYSRPACDRSVTPQFPRSPPPVMAIGPTITVKSLRTLKNSVIGNPSAKASLAQDETFVRVSVFNPFHTHLFWSVDDPGSHTPASSAV